MVKIWKVNIRLCKVLTLYLCTLYLLYCSFRKYWDESSQGHCGDVVAGVAWAVHCAVYSSAGISIVQPTVIVAMGNIFAVSSLCTAQ